MSLSCWQKNADSIANCAFPDQAVGFDRCLAFACMEEGSSLSRLAFLPLSLSFLASQSS